ncbi:MAG: RNase III inhibitor, partial [Candidatus Omnitrophica bacterium]|nr:RNase III inhibitor [Candidatus Omnitrophota bacterium]
AGAIHDGAGPGLEEECRPFAPIEPGEAVLTGAYNLPNNYVIHVLGPVYGKDRPGEEILKRCYRNVLTLAEKHRIRSIAFPALSTGAFGYPLRDAARTALSAVAGMSKELRQVRLIRFVLFSQEDFRVHEEALEGVTASE